MAVRNKRKNKRYARKRVLRATDAFREPMSASRRYYGNGNGNGEGSYAGIE